MNAPCTSVDEPEFKQINRELDILVTRLSVIKRATVSISDSLIGVQATGAELETSAKTTTPEYFTAKCFNAMDDFRTEVEQLEVVTKRLLRHIQEVEE